MKGPINFHQVAANLWRSGQPTDEEWLVIKEGIGITCVLSLNENPDEAAKRCGLVVVHSHIVDGKQPGGAQSLDFDASILDTLDHVLDGCLAAGQRVLVHCTGGVDRTGILIARWRVRHGATKDEAYADWVEKGSHRYVGLERAWSEWQP